MSRRTVLRPDAIKEDKLEDEDGNTFIAVEENENEDKIRFGTGGSERMIIDNAGRVGIGTSAPTEILTLNGDESASDETMIKFTEAGTDRALIGINTSNNLLIQNDFSNKHIVFKANDAGTIKEGLRLDGAVPEVVVNQNGASGENNTLVDFRVESDHSTHMFFVDGSANRIGIGTSSPQNVIDIIDPLDGSGQEADAVIRLRSKRDVGIKLIADIAGTDGEADNPFIHFYQDGQTDTTGDGNRLVELAMEGNAGTAFTDSIANAFYIDAYCPGATPTNTRTIQIANDSQNNGHAARITIEGDHGYVGIHTSDPSAELEVDGDVKVSGQITAATQPAFLARKPSNNQDAFAIDAGVDVTLSTEDFDVGSNFASNTFTAPTTGVYIFTANIYLTNLDTDANSYSLELVTTAGTYRLATVDPGGFSNDLTQYILGGSIPVSLAAGDTAKIQVRQSGGTQQTNIRGAATRGTFFAGYLLG